MAFPIDSERAPEDRIQYLFLLVLLLTTTHLFIVHTFPLERIGMDQESCVMHGPG